MAEYALVVGIERYETPAPTLKGPSLDALKFALWLSQKEPKVPAKNIIVIQNKSDKWDAGPMSIYQQTLDKVIAAGIEVRENPSRKAIANAWRKELLAGKLEPGTLWLYWSGHGVTFPQNREAVLCADVEETDPTYIFLGEFRDSFRSLEYKRFGQQRLIVDACAQYMKPEILSIKGFRNPATFTITEKPEQIELDAVAVGYTAQAEDGGSLFSRILLAELNKGGWPSDLPKFYGALGEAIGHETKDKNKLPRLRILSPQFQAGFEMGDHADECEQLLGMLGRCQISFDSYQPFYLRTMGRLTPNPEVLYVTNLTEMIRELLQLERDAEYGGHSQGLVEFFERVTREFKQAAAPIEEWLKSVPDGARLTVDKELKQEASDLVLTIRLIESAAGPDDFPVTIHADLSDANFTGTVLRWDDKLKDRESLETKARQILNEAHAQARRQRDVKLRVQVFANPPLMGVPWHAFQMNPNDDIDSTAFGEFYPFVLRSRGRLDRSAEYDLDSWKQKAKALRQRPCDKIVFESAPPWSNEGKKAVNVTLAKVDGLLLIPDILAARSPATEGLYKLLTAAMRRGVPLAIWPVALPGEEKADCAPPEFVKDLKALFATCGSLIQTPEHFRDERKTKEWARQAALFWDDDDTDKLLNLIGEEPTQVN